MIPFKVACQRFGFLCQKVITVGVDFFFFFYIKRGKHPLVNMYTFLMNLKF